jgi:hypothetical protein
MQVGYLVALCIEKKHKGTREMGELQDAARGETCASLRRSGIMGCTGGWCASYTHRTITATLLIDRETFNVEGELGVGGYVGEGLVAVG